MLIFLWYKGKSLEKFSTWAKQHLINKTCKAQALTWKIVFWHAFKSGRDKVTSQLNRKVSNHPMININVYWYASKSGKDMMSSQLSKKVYDHSMYII